MALITAKGLADEGPERPWVNDLGLNDPRRAKVWKALERESILQRSALRDGARPRKRRPSLPRYRDTSTFPL